MSCPARSDWIPPQTTLVFCCQSEILLNAIASAWSEILIDAERARRRNRNAFGYDSTLLGVRRNLLALVASRSVWARASPSDWRRGATGHPQMPFGMARTFHQLEVRGV